MVTSSGQRISLRGRPLVISHKLISYICHFRMSFCKYITHPKTLSDLAELSIPPRVIITLCDCFRPRPLSGYPRAQAFIPVNPLQHRDRHLALAWQHGHRGEKPHFIRRFCARCVYMTRLCQIASESRRHFDHLNLGWRSRISTRRYSV